MRKFSIISLLVFMAVFALITVSYSKSWSHINSLAEYTDGSSEWVAFLNWYPLKVVDSLNGVTVKYTDFESKNLSGNIDLKNFIQLCNASLAFAILAWIGSLAMIVLSIADIIEIKLPPIGKFLGWIVFLFSLLSFLIYLGTPAAKRKDCDNNFDNCESLYFYQKKFIGTFTGYVDERVVEFKYGPSAGWNCIVIACAVSLLGSVFNLFFFNHQNV
ncbi:hypothetical protein DDB_G0286265 [Dictyostelium discoideum AX4]|uniref:Uncharacterized protein n=1 Tax=Dictyostelium discoideum TaxID=44689 RepID=Q54M14_DICDI|nr:hypothetical protein DDB_G0286265 [Dictyostelium discoideum AX4]EAL64308.1 hypothetical protein DDB_G0286265 [Dictyostelium discoideum AX4]|eukprot:XP_637817.1 hypothetical protein DDB_G0286265 [Dictyostelium discoideum AX4]